MKKIPAIQGIIRHRFLLNFRLNPEVVQPLLPEGFEPKLRKGYAMGGICLIRLEKIRPKAVPLSLGISSENSAHRFAVKWRGGEGVYIARRDTDSVLNHVAGGRVFPGVHHLARFGVEQDGPHYEYWMKSTDDAVEVSFGGAACSNLPETSCFDNLEEASKFFELGRLGYSESEESGKLEGLLLHTRLWKARPFAVHDLYSSYFADTQRFPRGTVEFDHALIMENIDHEWHAAGQIARQNSAARPQPPAPVTDPAVRAPHGPPLPRSLRGSP
jgi:hypothetical protein